MSPDELATTLEHLAEVLQNQRTLGAALATIAEAATVSVPRCDAASIALTIEGRPVSMAATARVALELDLVQYDLHDGPCLTTFRTMESLRLNLVEQGDPFPHFAARARARGIRGVLSVPALWGHDIVATLNLYSRSGPFDETASTVAAVLATQVTIAVSRSPEFIAARDVVEHAQRSADDQADMNLATGLLMINQACTVEQAEGLLRQAAVQDERTVMEIARRIIEQQQAAG